MNTNERDVTGRRYLCIHGHFYQPPRENPWLEAVEEQPSARPYHDWNERITDECYRPNAASRILNGDGLIQDIVNNYSKISFNFGPTLLSWLEEHAADVYDAILRADKASVTRHGGHGAALAQVYGHAIMPLLNEQDKRTQVVWGLRDFERRFARKPEGMWLAETAVDISTLEILAEYGIQYTILAPHQAKRVRSLGAKEWEDIQGSGIDPKVPYLQRLPSGRTIAVFFYDGPVSQGVAFERLLERGETFAERLIGAFSKDEAGPQLVHIATDGETYGHHHPHGDMALAYALRFIEEKGLAQVVNYGQYLAIQPPVHEVEIVERSSWSCMHGVERWRSHCGCHSGATPDWQQAWRTPLREALDWLRDETVPLYAEAARELFYDPWAARNDYIDVILDKHSAESIQALLAKHQRAPLAGEQRVRALKLLEQQRHALLMYTSCGWFFDDISGIETVQVMAYGARSLQLAEELFDRSLELGFVERLAKAKSNVPSEQNGRKIYETRIKPAMVSLLQVGAHFAINLAFESAETPVYCYSINLESFQRFEAGRARLFAGQATLRSKITAEELPVAFGTLHLGDHTLVAGVHPEMSQEAYAAFLEHIRPAFLRADFPESLRALDQHFPERFSMKSLFHDEQRRAVANTLDLAMGDMAHEYERLYTRNEALLAFVADVGAEAPPELHLVASYVLHRRLAQLLASSDTQDQAVVSLLERVERFRVTLRSDELRAVYQVTLGTLAMRWAQAYGAAQAASDEQEQCTQRFARWIALGTRLPFNIDWSAAQTVYFRIMSQRRERLGETADPTGELSNLGRALGFDLGPAHV